MEPLLQDSAAKLGASLDLLFASVDDYAGFNPARPYTPKEREPFDALSDRYLRAFESCLKYFRTYERMREVAVSETFRDLLQRMHKVGLITDVQTWLNLRDLRNRIAHEYLPEELASIYTGIITTASREMRALRARVDALR